MRRGVWFWGVGLALGSTRPRVRGPWVLSQPLGPTSGREGSARCYQRFCKFVTSFENDCHIVTSCSPLQLCVRFHVTVLTAVLWQSVHVSSRQVVHLRRLQGCDVNYISIKKNLKQNNINSNDTNSTPWPRRGGTPSVGGWADLGLHSEPFQMCLSWGPAAICARVLIFVCTHVRVPQGLVVRMK